MQYFQTWHIVTCLSGWYWFWKNYVVVMYFQKNHPVKQPNKLMQNLCLVRRTLIHSDWNISNKNCFNLKIFILWRANWVISEVFLYGYGPFKASTRNHIIFLLYQNQSRYKVITFSMLLFYTNLRHSVGTQRRVAQAWDVFDRVFRCHIPTLHCCVGNTKFNRYFSWLHYWHSIL